MVRGVNHLLQTTKQMSSTGQVTKIQNFGGHTRLPLRIMILERLLHQSLLKGRATGT